MQWHLSTVDRNRRQPGKYYLNLVARLGNGQTRLQIATEVKDFISSKMCRQTRESTQSLIQRVHELSGYLGCQDNNSPQSNAEVTNEGS